MRAWNRLRAWLIAARLERELAEEMDAHRKLLEEQFLREGLSPRDARLAASRRFGNLTAAVDRSREQWRVRAFDSIAQDLAFAFRLLRRQPLLAAAAVVTIALGVGANTAVTSVVQAALLNPLGLHDTRGVMVATVSIEKIHLRYAETSAVEYGELAAMRDTFATAAAIEGRWWTAEGGGDASRLVGSAVTPGFFAIFNERPQLGRFFNADDRESVVLSHDLWRSRFGADPAVVGKTLMLDGKPHRIVGVAAETFRLPGKDAWTPLIIAPSRFQHRGYAMMLTVFLRRRETITEAQAVDRVNRHVAAFLATPDGKEMKDYGYSIDLRPYAQYVAGDLRRPILIVWAAALLVLVTGCVNVAGLLLARSAGRKREMAIRFSLGASGARILRQLLVESLLIGCIGGVAGIGVAAAGIAVARTITIPGGAMLKTLALGDRLVLYALAVAVGTALLFGLAPAVQLLRRDQAAALARTRRRWQNMFVVAEVAVASLLLVMAVLLVRSLSAVERVQPGFDPANVTTAFVLKPQNDATFLDRLALQLSATAGVESSALAYPLPFTNGGLTSGFSIRNREQRAGEPEWHGEAYMISPGYLRTMRIPLLRGRDIAQSDAPDAPTVCLVDSVFAQRFFPGGDPIGQEIGMYKGWARIVGVTAAVRGTALEGLARPVVYYPLAQVPFFNSAGLVVRTPLPALPILRAAVRQASSRAPIFDVNTMEERIQRSLGVRRLLVDLLGAFALMTALLSAVGLHGVVAQVVGERTAEIGVRMALGARPGQVLWHFLRQGLRAGALGLAVGLVAASYAQRSIVSLLYGIQPFDAPTFIVVSVGLLAVLAVAVWWPARRAAAIDPQVALRYE